MKISQVGDTQAWGFCKPSFLGKYAKNIEQLKADYFFTVK
jgi:hypothetical protein